MIFTSLDFLIFLGLVFPLHWLVFSRSLTAQNLFLLLASYVFYGYWDVRFLGLMVATSVGDYIFSRQMAASTHPTTRRAWLLASLGANLGLLGFFKYSRFLADTLWPGGAFSTWSLVLPVGISFYTFQAVSYTVDVYRGRPPAANLLEFLLYVAFFPHLVAGPIQRANELLVQFGARRSLTPDALSIGTRYILWGCFKKLVVGDNCAPLVDTVFAEQSLHGVALWLGLLLFAFQIYADFSGYSDIAIGVAALFGIRLGLNFRSPYLAQNPREFWQRWHISLSTWFRDYVYIPLGGNRHHWRRNLLLTFVASGLWHGANWTFLLWGAGHGLLYLLWPRAATAKRGGIRALSWAAHFTAVSWLWLFFRAPSLPQAADYALRACGPGGAMPMAWETETLVCAGIGIAVTLLVERLCRHQAHPCDRLATLPTLSRHLTYGLLLGMTYLLGNLQAGYDFIYFQF